MPHKSPTVYPSTSSAVAADRKSRGVDFASNRDRRIGYCQQSRRELSRLLAAGLSFPFVINGCVCHLIGQPTTAAETKEKRMRNTVSEVPDRRAQLFRAPPAWPRVASGVQGVVRPSFPIRHGASLRPTERQ